MTASDGTIENKSTSENVSAPHPIRAVILDFGMVLCNAPSDAHLDRFSKIFGLDRAGFWTAYDENRLALDRGDLSPDEYWSAFAAGAGHTLDARTLEQLKLWDVEMWLTLNDPMLDWVERLSAAGYKLGLLSNLHQTFATHLREHAGWLRHFHAPVFSAEVRRTKPDPEIYRLILDRLGVQPAESLFVDDRQINIEAARHLGIAALRYESVPQLRADLRSLCFPLLP
jgi:putative hydrolase of the HAD superfamily